MAKSDKPAADHEVEQEVVQGQGMPALDEATFQQLLEAAHVIQEQKASVPAAAPRPKQPDPTEALAEIVKTQEFLRAQPSDLHMTADLIAKRLLKITSATGVAVAIVHGNELEYWAGTGDASALVGSHVEFDSKVPADAPLRTQFSQERTDKQSIALSLLHGGKLAGLLEVRFPKPQTIAEPETRSCQLMAGLMTEAIARAADEEWKQALATERTAMLEALERIKPQLERLAVGQGGSAEEAEEDDVAAPARRIVEAADRLVRPEGVKPAFPRSEAVAKAREAMCPQCGYQFGEGELFCGRCGTARPAAATVPSGDLQSKWASLWHMQQEAEAKHRDEQAQPVRSEKDESGEIALPVVAGDHGSDDLNDELTPELEKMLAELSEAAEKGEEAEKSETALVLHKENNEKEKEEEDALAVAPPAPIEYPWGSAAKARRWLESLEKSSGGTWLAKHRGDIYVGAAVILLLLAWSMRSPDNRGQAKGSSQPSLTLFEKLMVNLGLAETPPVPVYRGNPNAQVWVDLHTALYYCSGADLYGKTPGGKFESQRDAQLDQFEPAERKPCD